MHTLLGQNFVFNQIELLYPQELKNLNLIELIKYQGILIQLTLNNIKESLKLILDIYLTKELL